MKMRILVLSLVGIFNTSSVFAAHTSREDVHIVGPNFMKADKQINIKFGKISYIFWFSDESTGEHIMAYFANLRNKEQPNEKPLSTDNLTLLKAGRQIARDEPLCHEQLSTYTTLQLASRLVSHGAKKKLQESIDTAKTQGNIMSRLEALPAMLEELNSDLGRGDEWYDKRGDTEKGWYWAVTDLQNIHGLLDDVLPNKKLAPKDRMTVLESLYTLFDIPNDILADMSKLYNTLNPDNLSEKEKAEKEMIKGILHEQKPFDPSDAIFTSVKKYLGKTLLFNYMLATIAEACAETELKHYNADRMPEFTYDVFTLVTETFDRNQGTSFKFAKLVDMFTEARKLR